MMPNFDFNFFKNLFKVGMTRENFINAYSELFNNPDSSADELDGISIFDADKKEAVAGQLFDMLNINKASNNQEDTLDADEISAFANLDKTDGEDNLTISDLKVLMNNYKETLEKDMKIDTPEKMYEAAMSKPAQNGNSSDDYLTALDYQISVLEDLINNRQISSNQIILEYENEINNLIQNDTNISADLKSKYKKENSDLNNLVKTQNTINKQIKDKQTELDSANSDYQNLQENIEYAQSSDDEENDYSSDLSRSEKLINTLSSELEELQGKSSSLSSKISKVKQNLQSYQEKAKSQSSDFKQKSDMINKRIELERQSCDKDVENYNARLSGLKEAQSYAIQRIQAESAASYSDSVGNGSDTYVFDESNYDEKAVAELEQRWASKASKNGLDHKFFVKVTAIAHDLKCDPNALLALMNSESGLNPSASNPNGGATGLIQFMPSTAKALGTTTAQLKNMSAYDQLDYVAKFFEKNKKTYNIGDGPMSAGDLYSLVFLPARSNREVLTSKGEIYYKANAGLDVDGDGQITKSDLDKRVAKFMA